MKRLKKKLLTIALFNSIGFSNSELEAAYVGLVDQLISLTHIVE